MINLTMSAGKYNIQINQGKLYDKTFTWTIDGTPVNLTGYTAKFRMYTTAAVVITLTTSLDANGNGIILGGAAGTLELIMKTALTGTLTFKKVSYEIELTQPNGEDIPFLVGGAYLTREYIDP